MVRNLALMAIACMGFAATTTLAEEKRQLGAHQHGHGTLKIVIDGAMLNMELDVPGADIVGFEHAAKTSTEKAAVEKAKAQLADPLKLFVPPAAAGCSVKSAEVKIETGNAGHSDFNGDYTLTCANADKLTSFDFPFFSMFKRADALSVTTLAPAGGEVSAEVTRKKPRLDLKR
jgi:Protein of unknown function (DUF2796)